MKISTKGRYALRLMLDLAMDGSGEYVTIKNISDRQEISGKYLEQIITQLCRAGYVISARGANGGYKLAHAPEQYTVGMIVRLMEGSLAPVPCLESETNTCDRAPHCVTVEVWKKVQDAMEGVIDNITLADLVKRQKKIGLPDAQIDQ